METDVIIKKVAIAVFINYFFFKNKQKTTKISLNEDYKKGHLTYIKDSRCNDIP